MSELCRRCCPSCPRILLRSLSIHSPVLVRCLSEPMEHLPAEGAGLLQAEDLVMQPEIEAIVLDLDSSIAPAELGAAVRIDLRAWGPRLRLGCGVAQFAAFQRELAGQLAGLPRERAAMVFGGSGDFHHVSLALL